MVIENLNDISFSGVANLTKKNYVCLDDLRELVVKWIKEDLKKPKEPYELIADWMRRLNITGEDLKETEINSQESNNKIGDSKGKVARPSNAPTPVKKCQALDCKRDAIVKVRDGWRWSWVCSIHMGGLTPL